MGLFDNLFKAKPDAADEAVVEAAKRISEAEKARLLQAAKAPVAAPTPRTGTVPTGKPSGVPPTRAYSPRTLGQVVTPGRPGETKPGTARRIKLSAADAAARPNEVLLLLEDVLPRIPMELLKEGPHDLKRQLRFKVEDLSADIARGRAAVSLGRIAAQIPDIFVDTVAESDPRQIRLPLQKLVEQIGFLPSKPVAPAPAPASAPAALGAPEQMPPIFKPLPPGATKQPTLIPPAVTSAPPESTPVAPAPAPAPIPAPTPAPAPAIAAAPTPAPAPLPVAATSAESPAPAGLRISLRLAEVLRNCPKELIVAELPSISDDERISLAWPPIEKQLKNGEVEISSVRFIFALPAHLQGFFEAREGVRVPLPLTEIYRNIPTRPAQVEETVPPPPIVPPVPAPTAEPPEPAAEPPAKAEAPPAEPPLPPEEEKTPAPPAETLPESLSAAPEVDIMVPPVAPPAPEPEPTEAFALCIETSSPVEIPPAPAPLAEGSFEIPEQIFVRKSEPLVEPVVPLVVDETPSIVAPPAIVEPPKAELPPEPEAPEESVSEPELPPVPSIAPPEDIVASLKEIEIAEEPKEEAKEVEPTALAPEEAAPAPALEEPAVEEVAPVSSIETPEPVEPVAAVAEPAPAEPEAEPIAAAAEETLKMEEVKVEPHLELAPPIVVHAPPPLPVLPPQEAPAAAPSEPVAADQPVEPEPPAEIPSAGEIPAVAAAMTPPIFVPPPLRQGGEGLEPKVPEPSEPVASGESQITPPNTWMQPPPELGARPSSAPWPPDVAPPPSPILPVRVVAPPVVRPFVAPPPLFGAGAGDVAPAAEVMPPEPVAPEPPPPEPLRLEAACIAAGLSETATLADIGKELTRLPGMTACLLSARHESAHGGELPAGFDPEAALALGRQLTGAVQTSVDKLAAERMQHLTIFADAYCLSFFANGEAVLCAIHRTRASLPGVNEKLAAVVTALADA